MHIELQSKPLPWWEKGRRWYKKLSGGCWKVRAPVRRKKEIYLRLLSSRHLCGNAPGDSPGLISPLFSPGRGFAFIVGSSAINILRQRTAYFFNQFQFSSQLLDTYNLSNMIGNVSVRPFINIRSAKCVFL